MAIVTVASMLSDMKRSKDIIEEPLVALFQSGKGKKNTKTEEVKDEKEDKGTDVLVGK